MLVMEFFKQCYWIGYYHQLKENLILTMLGLQEILQQIEWAIANGTL